MKSLYFNTAWLLLALLCVGVTGCKKESLPVVAKGEPTYISLSTKALNPGIAGSQINTVRVILINPAANHIIELNEFIDSIANPLIIPIKTGTYDVYVVANEDADSIENTALSNVYNLPTLRAVSLPFDAIKHDLTNVPMFGEVKNVTITAPILGESSPTNLASVSINGIPNGTILPVELERMASKVSVKIISSNRSVTGVAISMPTSISLFEDVLLPFGTNQVKSIEGNSFTLTESPVDQSAHILECKDILIPSKMFADPTDKSQAMQIRFTFSEGENLNITELGHLISEATKDYRIKRNHNYEITITVKDKILFTEITLKPWTFVDDNVDAL